MEEEEQHKKKKISFGFSSAHDSTKLIDILSEDDDFLVASPFVDPHQNPFSGFRLSGFGNNASEVEIIRQKEQKLLPSDSAHPTRPSFLRRSLAWDSAFFDSPGVLDHDELSFMNNGFTKDVRKRRSETGSMPKNIDDDTVEWFEIEPSIYKAKSHKVSSMANRSRLKQEGLRNVRDLKNVEKSLANKMKSTQISTAKSINVQKNESISRMRRGMISSPKPPRALGRTAYVPTRLHNRDFSETTTSSGQTTTTKSISLTPVQDSSLSSRKVEPGNSKPLASLSTSKIQRIGERSTRRMANVSLSTSSLSLSNIVTSPAFPTESLSAKNLRPSGLRPPSPQMRFFDENTPPRYQDGVTRSRKVPQRDHSSSEFLPHSSIDNRYASACKKLKTPMSEATNNIKKPKINHTSMSLTTAGEIHGKRPRNKLGLNSSMEEEKRRDTMKNKRKAITDQGKNGDAFSDKQLANLSRCLEAVDLNQDSATQVKRKQKNGYSAVKPKHFQLSPPPQSASIAAAAASIRTPLADKTYTRNLIGTFVWPSPMESKKD